MLGIEGEPVRLPFLVFGRCPEACVGHRRLNVPLPVVGAVTFDEAGEGSPDGVVGLGSGGAELGALALPVHLVVDGAWAPEAVGQVGEAHEVELVLSRVGAGVGLDVVASGVVSHPVGGGGHGGADVLASGVRAQHELGGGSVISLVYIA